MILALQQGQYLLVEEVERDEECVLEWAFVYLDEVIDFLGVRLLCGFLNIIEFCFRAVRTNIPYFLLFFKYD